LCPFKHAEVTLSPPALAAQQARLKEEADKRAAIFERNQAEIAGGEAEIAGGEAEIAGGEAEIAGGEAEIAGGEAEQPCLQQESAEAALGWERFSAPARSSGPDSALSRKAASSKRNTFGVSEKYQTPAKNKEKDMTPGLFGVRAYFTHLRLPLSPPPQQQQQQQRTLFKEAQALPIISSAVGIGAIQSPLGLQSENAQRRAQCQTSQCLSENVVATGNPQQPAIHQRPLHQQQPQHQFALPRASLASSLPMSALPGTPLVATAVEMHPLALQKTQWSNMGPTEAGAASAVRAKRKVDDSGSKPPKRSKYASSSAAGVEGTYSLHPDPFSSMSIYNNPPTVFGQLPPPGQFITTQELPLGVTSSSSPNIAPQLSICHQPISSCSSSGDVGMLRTGEAQLELSSAASFQQQSLQAQPHFSVHSSPQHNFHLNYLPSTDRDAQVRPCIDNVHMISPAQLRYSNSHQLTLLQRPGQSGPLSVGFHKAPDSGSPPFLGALIYSPHVPAKPTKQPLAADPISPVMKACCWRQQMLEASPNGAAAAAGGVDIRTPKSALLDPHRAAFASLRMQAAVIREQESQRLATQLVAQPALLKTQRVEPTAQRKHGAQQLAADKEQLQTQPVLLNNDRFGESLPPVPLMMHLSTSPSTSHSMLAHQQYFQAHPNFSSGAVNRKEQGQKMLEQVI